jgi:hypothetical protein
MATQILRTIDRWRFEAPLSLALAAAAGFAAMAMPPAIFGHVPLLGHHGRLGHSALALVLALVSGGIGYVAMRRPTKSVAAADDDDFIDVLGEPMAPIVGENDGPVRMRRADRHPDAPPRPPIRASRDLGEPFMDVGTQGLSSEREAVVPADSAAADSVVVAQDPIDDAALIEPEPRVEPVAVPDAFEVQAIDAEPFVAEAALQPVSEPAPAPAEEAVAEPAATAFVAAIADAAPVVAAQDESSITAMMERLSAGMARRAANADRDAAAGVPTPMRDMRPALRGALDELNRLAARRG